MKKQILAYSDKLTYEMQQSNNSSIEQTFDKLEKYFAFVKKSLSLVIKW